jgi:hypothetical protein
MRRYPLWTPEEDRLLIDTYRTSSLAAAVKAVPGRTRNAVRSRLKQLGVVSHAAIAGKPVPARRKPVRNFDSRKLLDLIGERIRKRAA